MRLRPYKSCDAKKIISWIRDEEVFHKWGGDHFGEYPISAEIVDNKYLNDNGDCNEEDNFYPWIAFTDEDGVIGHFIMRYIHGDNKVLRFGWVIVDDSIRGKGYGTSMLRRYIMGEIDLQGIAAERTIAYETAKGKIRDLKKLLKERTLSFLEEGEVA